MKIKHIAPIAFALLLLTSCAWENAVPDPGPAAQTRGLMQVEIAENNGQGADKIQTIRFIVFRNVNGSPKMEINEFYDEDDFVIETPSSGKAASRVKITLELHYRASSGEEKMVVAIVNEPGGENGPLNLGAVTSPAELEGKELTLATILNGNHTALQSSVQMPMSGAIWVDEEDYSHATEEEAEQHYLNLFVSRALARVDLYLVNGGTDTENITVSSGSQVTLTNTYTQSPFVYHREGTHTLGRIQTVTSGLVPLTWTSAAALSIPPRDIDHPISADSVLVCSFYTPERTCIAAADADKLRIDLSAKLGTEGTKSGFIVLDKALNVKDNTVRPLTAINRNNAYRVTATIGVSGITGIVQDWNTEYFPTEF